MSSETETKAPDLSSACLSPLRRAAEAGLTQGRKTKHINAKVTPALFAAAAERVGSDSPAKVVEAALASLATRDGLGPWLASQWGVLADIDPEILEQLTF
jgi:hypothetical protein